MDILVDGVSGTGKSIICARCGKVLAVYAKRSDMDIFVCDPIWTDLVDKDIVFVQQIKCNRCKTVTTAILKQSFEARPPLVSEQAVVYNTT